MLELPIFDCETKVLSHPSQFGDAAASEEPQFTRTINIHYVRQLGGTSLKECLEATDAELEEIATICEAEVVGHQWGLFVPGPGVHISWPRSEPRDIVPKGHVLVARVDSIKKNPLNATETSTLGEQTKYYKTQRQLARQPFIYDILPKQFIEKGTSPKGIETRWLVDIEPRWHLFD